MRQIKKLIVHCSDSEFGDAKQIDAWHKQRGWQGIGYHHVILNGVRVAHTPFKSIENGLVEPGRDESVVGAHCEGHNSDSIGICLIGIRSFTPGQFAALGDLLKALMERYGLTPDDVYGHYEMDTAHGKTCPNMDMNAVRAALRVYEEHPISNCGR